MLFLSDFATLTLEGLRPGEKSEDDDAAFGLGGDGERGKRDEAKREEVLALGASGGEDGGLGRRSEDCCDCLPCKYVAVFGGTGGRSVSESDMGSKKSDGSWDWERSRVWVTRPSSRGMSSSMPIRAMRSLSIPFAIRDDHD